jgi:hypothetical protein
VDVADQKSEDSSDAISETAIISLVESQGEAPRSDLGESVGPDLQ